MPLWKGFVGERCPHCREGKVFKHSMLNVSKFSQMHDSCPVCGQDLVIELGFYWGAMYVGYAINVALIMILSLILFLGFPEASVYVYLAVIIPPIVVLVPFNFRFGRIGMVYFFGSIKYDPDYVPLNQEGAKKGDASASSN